MSQAPTVAPAVVYTTQTETVVMVDPHLRESRQVVLPAGTQVIVVPPK